jgi:predicted RNA-binding protein with TRAM domain
LSTDGTTALTNGTSYNVQIRAVNAQGYGTASASASGTPSLYCIPSGSSSSTTYISNFTTTNAINNINNTSTYSTSGYGAFTEQFVSQYANNTVNFTVSIVSPTVGIGVWVDWNNNGVFTDAGENVYNSGGYVNSASSSFSVPIGQATGNYRMRVIANYNAPTPASCVAASSAQGEAEDYTFTVLSPVAPSAPIITSVTPTASGTLSAAFNAGAANGSAITNYKYSIDNGTSFTAVSPSQTTSPVVIGGLTPGTNYQIQLRAVNAIGDGAASASTSATAATTPSAPTITGITAGNAQLSVAFTAPGSNGFSTITDYQYSTNGGSSFTSVGNTTSPVVITGLTNNTNYQVQLRAVNAVGNGTASASSVGTPVAQLPSAPTGVSIAAGDGQLSVAFTAGSNGGSAITNYKYSIDGGASFTALSPALTTSPIIIAGLTNGTTYQVQIKAVNGIGDGVASASISGTPAVVIYQHNFGTSTPTTPYTAVPPTFNSNLSTSSWSCAGTFINAGGSSGQSLAVSSTGSGPFTLTFNVASGYQLSVSSYNYWRYTSSSASVSSITINGTNITSGALSAATNPGASIGTTNVANAISGLTGTITVIINITGSGSFRLDDFTLSGNVTCITPTQPSTITGNTEVCESSSQIYSVTNTSGVGYTWSLPSGWGGTSITNSITATPSSTSGNISVTPYNSASGCTSVTGTPRILSVTVSSLPSAPTANAQTFCAASTPTVTGLSATGSGVLWYFASSGGPSLATSTALTSGTYYASQTVSGCESSSRASVAVTVNSSGTWIGGATGNWNSSGNWCGGVPSSSASVTIPSGVTVTVDAGTTVADLTVNGTLIISTGKTLSVNGALTNTGTIRLESDGTTSGQLMQGSTALASGDGTCEYTRVMPLVPNTAPGIPTNMNRSYYFGSPVASAYSSGSYQPVSISTGLSGSNNASLNLFNYNEVSNQFTNLITTGAVASNASLAPGTGYALISSPLINGGTYFGQATVTGKYFMNGNISVNVTKTGTNGYNLLSNPYPSNLKWSDVLSSNVTIQGDVATYWVRTFDNQLGMIFKEFVVNGANGQGVGTGGQTNIIAPGQAFWVKVGASGTYTFNNGMRTTDAATNSYTASVNRIMRFNLANSTNGVDDIAVYLNENSSLGVDAFDAEKRIPSSAVHQLYTLEGTTKLAINGFNNALAKDTVLLGMQIPTAGTYTINASQIDATIEEDVFLEDKITGAYQNLKTTPSYSFTSTQGTFNNRFVLHFAPFVPALPGQTAATAIAMPTSNWPQCNNVSTEDQWHAFTATSEGISIAVNTATTDIVIELQDGTGNVVAQENAVNGIGNETLNFFGLTAGQTYKVGVRNNISSQPTGTYGICVKSLKRGGCDYGAGPYSLCQYYKATWAGSTGVSYTFTFTGTSGPAAGQTFTRTQNSDICVLSTVTPLLPYGSTYDVVISNTYTLTDGAGNTEQITVPSNNGCQVITIAEPQTALSNSSSCNNGARFRGAVVSSLPWICGSNNWRWRFTEVNPLTMQEVGLPIELNRGSASNYLNLGTVAQLQNGKTYAVQTAPMFSYTGTNYNWGPVQYLCIVGAANVTQDATQDAMQDPSEDAAQEAAQGSNKDTHASQDVTQDARDVQDAAQDLNAVVYVTEGNQLNIQLTNAANNTAKRADIYDVTGKLVKSVRLVEGMNEVTLTETAGIYMVRTVVGNQSETTRVFLNN